MSDCHYQFERPNFVLAREKAYELLLKQEYVKFGIDPEQIIIPEKTIIYDTMQNYCALTNSKITNLTADGKIKLGCHLNINDGQAYLILYNSEIYSHCCRSWTKAHEIGHICLNHTKDDCIEEIETNFFVSCLTMPDAVLRYFYDCGYTINVAFLMHYFNVSSDAAIKKIKTLNKYFPVTQYDEQIIELYRDDICNIINEIDTDIQLEYK